MGYIEEHIYVKMYGYKDKQELYNDICIEKGIAQITVPTFALHSKDDPVCLFQFTPVDKISKKDS